jgi:hypothetical protein
MRSNFADLILPSIGLQEVYQNLTFKKGYLDDPGCYPIIAILGFVTMFTVGFTASQAVHLKDLRFFNNRKHQQLQSWGQEHHDSITSHLAAGPMLMHGNDHRSTWTEGLGINHQEWQKQKAAKDAEPYHN